jgi:alpha-mannosidase
MVMVELADKMGFEAAQSFFLESAWNYDVQASKRRELEWACRSHNISPGEAYLDTLGFPRRNTARQCKVLVFRRCAAVLARRVIARGSPK